MMIQLKKIKELCGSVSFKRGEAFYNANKVVITHYSPRFYEVIVQGAEDFNVIIRMTDSHTIQTSCSCPSLIGFDKSCQHVAAALLAIRQLSEQKSVSKETRNSEVPLDLDALLRMKTTLNSLQQSHFEQRTVASTHFFLSAISADKDTRLFGIELYVNDIHISNIRAFLASIHAGIPYELNELHSFSITEYCFDAANDALLKQLFKLVRDEQLLSSRKHSTDESILIVAPSFWESIVHLLKKASLVSMSMHPNQVHSFQYVSKKPPFEFLLDREQDIFSLQINGFEQMEHFPAYAVVFNKDTLYQMNMPDSMQLTELEVLIAASEKRQITIPSTQIDWALQKLFPSLRNIGTLVQTARFIKEKKEVPLVAELYLDRLNNKLLASIEFRYGQFTIQPLSNEERPAMSVIRDYDKEIAILDLMDASGFSKTDSGYFMQNEEAEYQFLYHVLPSLQKMTAIFATTAVRQRLVKKSNFPRIIVKVKKERKNWLEFKFEMDGLTNREIKDVLEAIEFKQKYYRLKDDSLLSLESAEIAEIRQFLVAEPIQNDHFENTLDLPLLDGLAYLNSFDSSDVFQVEQSFQNLMTQFVQPATIDLPIPPSLEPLLRDYQKAGYKWLKQLANFGFGGILADTMGLGKTIQSIAYIVSVLPEIRKNKQPILVACPSSLTYNWLQELIKFAPEVQAIVIDGTKKQRIDLLKDLSQIDVVIVSYPLLRHDATSYTSLYFHTIFFDEAQAFKNPTTQTARTVKKLQADHRFALTGTPVENRQEELWSIFYVVFPHLFHGLEAYSRLNRKAIARRIRPFMLRRLKEDVLQELPAKEESIELAVLTIEQKQLYAAFLAKLKHDTFKHLDKDTLRKNRIKILAGITRLRQICCHPILFVDDYKGRSGKFDKLMVILEEAKFTGRRVLIFSQFTKMLDIIGRELIRNGEDYFYLDGNTPSKERLALCNRFNNGERDLFLISLKAGGAGLNLTGADTVILYDLWWNPAVEDQAADRAHRIGQNKQVQVIKMITTGTIEEKMNELQEEKRSLIADIIEEGPTASSALTEEDIREILDLN